MIPKHLEARILRLHFVEKWSMGTIATQVGVHHSTVRRVLYRQGEHHRPVDGRPFLPFIHETFEKYPTLPASRLHTMITERGYTGSESHFRRLVGTLRPRNQRRPSSG